MAPDGVREIRHRVSPCLDVCRERGISTSYVVGRRSREAGEGGPFLCEDRRDSKLRLVAGELQMADVRQQVDLSMVTEFEDFSVFSQATATCPR